MLKVAEKSQMYLGVNISSSRIINTGSLTGVSTINIDPESESGNT